MEMDKMSGIKTVKGFINAVKRLESNTTMDLKGYNNLSEEQQLILGLMCASLGNLLGDFEDEFEGLKK